MELVLYPVKYFIRRLSGAALWVFIGTVVTVQLAFASEPGNAAITVIKADSKQPLSDAIVKIAPIDSSNTRSKALVGLTGQLGVYRYQFTSPCIIQISHLGYATVTDTLYNLQDKIYTITSSAQNVGDVVVTGQYGAGSTQKSVYEVKVVSNETIRAKGANNLREALQGELNIDLGQDQVFGSNLSINGISGEGIKILVDGVPIVGRLDGKIDLSQINVNNIERIEIVEGPLSVIYGTDAMGGVINIITKSHQAEKVNINLKGYYETVGQYNIEINAGFSFKKNQVFLSAGRNFFDGYTTADSIPRFQEWKPKEQYFVDGKYVYTGNRLKFSVAGSFFRELMLNRSEPREALSYDNNDTAWTYVGSDYHYLTYRPRASMALMYRFKEDYELNVLASYSGFIRFTNLYTKNLVTGNEKLVTDPTSQDTARYHQALVRATYTMPAWKNRLSFQFGLEANNEFTRQGRIENGKQSLGDYAAFGSVRINIVKGLDVQPAIRIVYNTRFRVPLIPSINVKYAYKDAFVIRASYGTGYRAPSLKELYLEFFDSNHSLKGNPDLVPERGHCVNGSVSYKQRIKAKHVLTFAASGFYNNITDKIDWKIIPAIGPVIDTYQYFNIKKYITYGGDVSVTYNWKRLQLSASGLITRYELSNSSSGSNKVKMMSPDFTATAGYRIPVIDVGLNVGYKYNGNKPLFSVNSSIQAGTRHAYHMLDVSLTRNFWKDRIQLTLGGKNLLGVKNVQADGLSSIGHGLSGNSVNIAWGTTFFTSLILHFSK